jgi:hypothetical protein
MADQQELNIGQVQGQQHYCRLKIKGQEIAAPSILSLTIREWVTDILPRIELIINDDGLLTEMLPLEDNDIINVVIAKHDEDDNRIELDFNLGDFQFGIMSENKRTVISMSGFLKVTDMFVLKSRSFKNKNSKDILQQIANENKISFDNPQGISPSDVMTWYQSTQSNFNFIKHVLQRSNISNDAIFFFGDSRNKFVYTSLKKELQKKDSITARYSINNYMRNDLPPEDKTSIWYNSYDVVNYSSFYNKINTYGTRYVYYNLSDVVSKDYTTSTKRTEVYYKDKDLANKVVQQKFFGTISVNTYDNYFESLVRNDFLKNEFLSQSIMLNINSLYPVKLFDKIDLNIPSMFESDQSNEVYSGEYLVGGIIHQVSSNGIYKKMISLHRNGMNKSTQMKIFRQAT